MIIKKIASDNLLSVNDVEALDRNVAYYLSEIADDGHFPDVDYGDKSRTNWKPMLHLDKLYQMVLAYVIPDGSHNSCMRRLCVAWNTGIKHTVKVRIGGIIKLGLHVCWERLWLY